MSDVILTENDEGIDITITVEEDGVAVDLSAEDVKQLKFRYPDGTGVAKTAEFVTNGTDGKLKYSTEAGFLTPAGRWGVQGYLEFTASGQKWHTEIGEFLVREAVV
jgi:hypothetical protein